METAQLLYFSLATFYLCSLMSFLLDCFFSGYAVVSHSARSLRTIRCCRRRRNFHLFFEKNIL